MKTNQEYKNAALAALKGNWAPSVIATIVLMAFTYLIIGPYVVMYMLNLNGMTPGSAGLSLGVYALYIFGFTFVFSPLNIGYTYAFNSLYMEGDNALTGNTFRFGFRRWGRNVWGMFLVGFFTSLWSLLLIVPGIIKFYAYAMTPYILIDNPELSANQAINLSCKMMKGHKFDLFFLQLSFIGWGILSVFTGGIGLLWLMPYMMSAQAVFYQDIKQNFLQTNINN